MRVRAYVRMYMCVCLLEKCLKFNGAAKCWISSSKHGLAALRYTGWQADPLFFLSLYLK
jgi:hypothetical protein